ncbi:hypothetical protein VA7868_02421 [Vibrio aerogenes CECT 7868]|uniref:Bacterial Ig-like domain-containing protein n=1 Tax=Vibrio aerogenes CECT 7868 TaxID=1216006 RepID=A0A1M5Z825_9VIBR|nr:Ig-like domain-containing protein [Vibrio aerogenes]SHI20351.1 hypothetical protein VA7868_02421 [Vibrio aerogenes CECT 7868]
MKCLYKTTYPLAIMLSVGSVCASAHDFTPDVNPAGLPSAFTKTTLASSVASASTTDTVTLTVSVTPSDATGYITFMDGPTVLGAAPLSSGAASFTAVLTEGTHNLSAKYNGAPAYKDSMSQPVTLTVETSDYGSWTSGACGRGTASYLLDSGTFTEQGATYTTSTDSDSAVCVTGSDAALVLEQPTITTSGESSSNEESSFFGLNAAVLNYDGGNLTIHGGSITSTGMGANSVFAYGSGVISVSDTTMKATADGGHAVFAAGGGTIIANNVDALTTGASSSVVGTDRGSGTVIVHGGTYKATGMRSAGIYSTGTITASDATFTTTNAEVVVLEGSNVVTLDNVTLNGISDLDEHRGVFLYQSMSGDADNSECGVGSCFTMTGGVFNYTDTSNTSETATDNCAAFVVANQTGTMTLNDVEVNNSCPTLLLSALNKHWDYKGGIANFTANGVKLAGDVIVDDVSTADITLAHSDLQPSELKGAINTDNTASSVSLTLDAESQWLVTGTSYLTSLTDTDTTYSNIRCATEDCKVYVDGTEIEIQ